MPDPPIRHELPADTSITIANDQLIIQDERANEVQFAATDAPQVVAGIIEAILDSNPDGAPTPAAAAVTEDLVRDPAVTLG
jgi:hypothetical protein